MLQQALLGVVGLRNFCTRFRPDEFASFPSPVRTSGSCVAPGDDTRNATSAIHMGSARDPYMRL